MPKKKKPLKRSEFDKIEQEFEEEISYYVKRILKSGSFTIIDSGSTFYWIEIASELFFIGADENLAVERAALRVADRYYLMPESQVYRLFGDDSLSNITIRVTYHIIETPAYLLN